MGNIFKSNRSKGYFKGTFLANQRWTANYLFLMRILKIVVKAEIIKKA
jgi:hypothetical protein